MKLGAPFTCLRSVLAASLVLLLGSSLAGAAETVKHLTYNRDIRPILSDNCFACHGPDKNKRKAKLRLDDRDVALEKKAIVPGKEDESELVSRIFSTDPDKQMPPPEAHKTLTEAQKQTLKQWIADGAEYEAFWAWVTPHRPPVPEVKDRAWVRNPIDAFILQKLEEKGLSPAPEADRRTLLRRLSLDLIGLPPTPEEMQAFLLDNSPDAYEKQVDRLLASPHYGERMAVPWLDAVRFADTVGYHGDQNQNVFPYRDYVINAFNSDKPFDQFTIEQLAGDLLPHPTTEQIVATGFNRLNMITREGGAQPKEYLAKYMADRVRTIGSCFLGATLGCCECHDHKYDPFSARDFYSMGAYFADIKQWGVYMDYGYTPNPDLKGFTNDHPFPPEIIVDSPYLQARQKRLKGQIDRVTESAAAELQKDDAKRAEFDAWKHSTADFLDKHPDGWACVKPIIEEATESKSRSRGIEATDDGAVLFTGKPGGSDRLEFALEPGTIAAIRLELLPHEKHDGSILRSGAMRPLIQLSAAIKPADGGKDRRAKIYFADADLKDDIFKNGYPVIGVVSGWKPSSQHLKSAQTAVYVLDHAERIEEGDRLVLSLSRDAIGCAKVSVSPIAPMNPIEPELGESLHKAIQDSSASSDSDKVLVDRAYLLTTGWDATALGEVRQLHHEVLECRGGKSPQVVTVSVKPYVTRVLPRGNWQDQSGAIVEPTPPHFLPQPKIEGRRQTRLDLAHWLVSSENPLTSRVIVNRLWKQLFGNGICNTVEDFGAQGEWPSHPELLDWLAIEFREGPSTALGTGPTDGSGKPWDIKRMVRLMVTSSAYRQQSNQSPKAREIDPNNRLLSAQNPRRLEAEFVRDNALAISGLICLDIGGPSVFPYQPAGYYANIQFPDRTYIASPDERQWRRGVYMHWQRTFLHPMLANFDAPSREDSVCTRNVSNTPQQALTLLNDPEFVEAARVLAQKVVADSTSDEARLETIYQRALGRAPKAKERESLLKFLAGQRGYYRENPEDARKLIHTGIAPVDSSQDASEVAAWTGVCRVVLNLHETITRY